MELEINKIAEEISDITEPTSMEKLLVYLEDIQMETEEYMQLLMEYVDDMIVTWEQPWYQSNITVLARPLKQKQGLAAFRTESFSKEEIELVDQNWKRFVKEFKVPDKPLCFARWRHIDGSRHGHTPEERVRQFVVAYLAQGLERNPYQVFKHILRHYGAPRKGEYSEAELKIMEVCFYHIPNKAVVYLAQILGREPRGLLKRFKNSYPGVDMPLEKKRVCWTLEIASKLLNRLLYHSGLPLEKLKYQTISKEVWLELQHDMDHDYLYLRQFWSTYLHVQVFVKCDVKMARLRRKIYKILLKSSYQVWTDISWKHVVKHFPDGFTPRFLHKCIYPITKSYPNFLRAPLRKVVAYGESKLSKLPSRRLRTLALNKDGQLEIVRYQNKLV